MCVEGQSKWEWQGRSLHYRRARSKLGPTLSWSSSGPGAECPCGQETSRQLQGLPARHVEPNAPVHKGISRSGPPTHDSRQFVSAEASC